MAEQIKTVQAILRRRQVEILTGLSRSTIYGKINEKSPSTFDASFPKPIRLSDKPNGSVGWIDEEVQRWIESRIRASRPEPNLTPTEEIIAQRSKYDSKTSASFQAAIRRG